MELHLLQTLGRMMGMNMTYVTVEEGYTTCYVYLMVPNLYGAYLRCVNCGAIRKARITRHLGQGMYGICSNVWNLKRIRSDGHEKQTLVPSYEYG